MNILYVSTLYPPSIGGAQIQLHYLAKAMQEAGHGVKTITLSGINRQDWLRMSTVLPEPEKHYEHEGVPVSQLGFSMATRLRMIPWTLTYYALLGPAARRLAALTRPRFDAAAGAPDVVHVSRIGREFIAMAAYDFARERNIPYVLTPNHHPRWSGRLYQDYDRLYRNADAMVVYTDIEKQTLVEEKGVAEDRVFVTGVGPVLAEAADEAAFRSEFNIEGPFVLYVGQQYKYKGIEAIVEAAPQVWAQYPEMKFVFIGPHTNDTGPVFERVTDRRIINLGIVSPAMKCAALDACELLTLPSTQESFGGVFAEAWCYKKAVIGGNIPPIAAVISEGVDGLLTKQEPGELASKICTLLADPERRRTMGEAGYQKVQDNYTFNRLAEKTLAAYQRVMR